MFTMMLLAHVLGDYVLQTNALARWKSRSALGVVAHGLLVTIATMGCALMVVPSWWPYALLIGIIHTLIDFVRARLIVVTHPTTELLWYLGDQFAHLTTIGLMILVSGVQTQTEMTHSPGVLLAVLILLQPAWVMLRFVVRAVWGATAAPPLGAGDKVIPMLERVLIAGLAFAGYGYLAPLILLPRHLGRLQMHGDTIIIRFVYITHWAETLLGTGLALSVGWALRLWLLAGGGG